MPTVCYSCGELGHHSDRCSNTEGMYCYKCKKSGHYSNKCPSKELSKPKEEVICYECKKSGHYSDRCPSKELSKPKEEVICYECKKSGHYSDRCPENKISDCCSVCNDAVRNCTLGCGHLCMCLVCAQRVTTCPICREPIKIR